MIKVVLLAMGGAISTQVLAALVDHQKVELRGIIKPKLKNSQPLIKVLMSLLPTKIQEKIRKYRIENMPIDKWQFPDLVNYNKIEEKLVDDINDTETEDYLKTLNPDFIIIANYNQILKNNILQIPNKATLNFHPSLLPEYRGANPIFWIFKNNESFGGISMHLVDAGIDTGGIIDQKKFELSINETFETYTQKCAKLAYKQVIDYFDQYNGTIKTDNGNRISRYYHKPRLDDGELRICGDLRLTFRNYLVMRKSIPVFIRINGKRFDIDKVKVKSKTIKDLYSEKKIVLSSNGFSIIFKGKLNG